MKKKLDVFFILDKSGSMSGSEENTISSFSEYLEREKKNKFDTRITTMLFSDNYKYLYKRMDVNKVNNLSYEDYFVGGCTGLYDAIGNGISYMDKCDTDKVIFIIITDGYENASREFNNKKIKKMIKNHSNWEFIYIGADIDSYAVGSEIGIKRDNISNYKKDKVGTSLLFKSISMFKEDMMCENADRSSWKAELEDYLEENNS